MRAAIDLYEHPDFSDEPSTGSFTKQNVCATVGTLTLAVLSTIAVYKLRPWDLRYVTLSNSPASIPEPLFPLPVFIQ
jgi:hypothetical protein